jgi:hypothetical protein
MAVEMNTRIMVQFIYELCGLLLIVFVIIAIVTVVWHLFVTANFILFALVVFVIRRIIEWRYGDLWKNNVENVQKK